MFFKRKALWIILCIAVVVGAGFYWYPNRPKELFRIKASNGNVLVVHAILNKPNERFWLQAANRDILYPGDGTLLILSLRAPVTDKYLDWDWFGGIEQLDKYGSRIVTTRAVQHSGGSGHWSSGNLGNASYSRYQDPLTFAMIHVPKVQTDGPAEYRLLDTSKQVMAVIQSPSYLTEKVAPDFESAKHKLDTRVGKWNLRLTDGSVLQRGFKHMDGFRFDRSRDFYPTIYYEYGDFPLNKDNVAIFNYQISDALGNRSFQANLPEQQPLWKLSMRVARVGMLDSPVDSTKLLGEFGVSTESRPKSEFGSCLSILGATAFQTGSHDQLLENAQISERNYQRGFSEVPQWTMDQLVQSGGGSSGGNEDVRDINVTTVTPSSQKAGGERGAEAKFRLRSKTNQKHAEMRFESNKPILAIQLEKPLENQILNINAYDQANRQLTVYAISMPIANYAFYLVCTESDTSSVRLDAFLEDVVPITFFMEPPTKFFTQDEKDENYTVRGTDSGWEVRYRSTE